MTANVLILSAAGMLVSAYLMLEVNRAVRITLTELEQVARELVEDLEAEDSA